MEKTNKNLLIFIFLILGLLVRVVLVRYGLTGDINAFAEWGMRFWQVGTRDFYEYLGWYYTFPTQPPLMNLIFGAIYWLSQQNIFALLHNYLIVFPTSIVLFFGKSVPNDPFMFTYGYYFFLKLLPILSDLALSLFIFKVVFSLTKDSQKAILALVFYLFNPITIFLSGVWGQVESFVALFGILAFLCIYYKKYFLALPLFFICLYLKPTWAHLAPFYLFVLYQYKPNVRQLVVGGLITFILFILITYPFSGTNFFGFSKDIVLNNMLPMAKGSGKLSVSAFNFYTIFWQIDKIFTSQVSNAFSVIVYILLNIISINYLRQTKDKLTGILLGIFVIGMGSYLFMDNMLERYFFPAFIPMIILSITRTKFLFKFLAINSVLFSNLVYSFYRRSSDEVGNIFTNNNFLVIRALSVVITDFFLNFTFRSMIQFKRG